MIGRWLMKRRYAHLLMLRDQGRRLTPAAKWELGTLRMALAPDFRPSDAELRACKVTPEGSKRDRKALSTFGFGGL